MREISTGRALFGIRRSAVRGDKVLLLSWNVTRAGNAARAQEAYGQIADNQQKSFSLQAIPTDH